MTSCSGSRTGSIELKTSLERQIEARGVRVSAAEQRDAQLAPSRDPAARWRQVEAERENCATIIAIEDLFEAAQTFAKSRRGSSPYRRNRPVLHAHAIRHTLAPECGLFVFLTKPR